MNTTPTPSVSAVCKEINALLFIPLSLVGAKLQLYLHGAYAKRVGRYERTINEHITAALSVLPFWLPFKVHFISLKSGGINLKRHH